MNPQYRVSPLGVAGAPQTMILFQTLKKVQIFI